MITEQIYRQLNAAYEAGVKRRPTYRYLRELDASQWLSRAEVDAMQLKALKALMVHAGRSCPWYSEMWQERGLDPSRLSHTSEMSAYPLVDRDTVNNERMRLRSSEWTENLIPKSTGGSSGTPLHFDITAESYVRRSAAAFRGYDWAGAGPGTLQYYLWGIPLGDLPKWKAAKNYLYHRVLNRRLVVNTFGLNEEAFARCHKQLGRMRPTAIVAYTSAVYEFARWLDANGLTPWTPHSIVVGAERLHDFQRELIERVFGCRVFETYGSREFTLIGAECEHHSGLHLTSEYLLVEIVDDDGQPVADGDEGNIVITDLYNYGMPFVRYVTGDRAIAGFGTCACGRGLPTLKSVTGRRLDVLETPAGRRIPGEFFPHLVKDFAAVERFQVVQERPECIELKIVPREGWDETAGDAITREFRKAADDTVQLRITLVDEIPLTVSGKQQVVVNRCHRPATVS